jgi:SAM-dependent methyltransferase
MLPRTSILRTKVQERPLVIDDALQAHYWEDQSHAFRPPEHAIVRFFAQQRWRYLERQLDLSGIKTALDVGCGDGFSTRYAPSHMRVVACDGSLTMLSRHTGGERIQADAFCLPFRDASFDMVFVWELLHHVSAPHRVLSEMARVSRRWVVCFEPNPLNIAQFLFALADRAHRWVLRFSRKFMVDQAREAGLQVIHFARGGCLFPNKTPQWLFPFLRLFPYRLPLIGISNCLIATTRS